MTIVACNSLDLVLAREVVTFEVVCLNMEGGGAGAPGGAEEFAADLQVVDWSIQSPMFWAYLHMVNVIGRVLASVSTWAEQCPCHESDPELQGSDRDKVDGLRARIGTSLCPLACRRAPEAVAGALRAFAGQLIQVANAEILLDPRTLRLPDQVGSRTSWCNASEISN